MSQVIIPVQIAMPDAEGRTFHEVKAGQSFWAIAVAYKITIHDLEVWNNLSRETGLQIGQKLFIPNSNTKGYSTPTQVGMIQVATPDADGRIVYSVQAYDTLITIAEAYSVKVDKILANNGLQVDWPLQIGQKLVIDPGNFTPSPTPRPLTPIEKLTPESDGKYYHTVKERGDFVVDLRLLRRGHGRADGVEWAGRQLDHHPRAKAVAAGDAACHRNARPSAGDAHTSPHRNPFARLLRLKAPRRMRHPPRRPVPDLKQRLPSPVGDDRHC